MQQQQTIATVDTVKIKAHLEDATMRLHFLSHIISKDDTSSELAGFEINKLLKEQDRLEKQYAELLRLRSTLKGITNKRKADQVQESIQGVARDLKESTKKLCRMFRENPDLASDAEKIKRERMSVIDELEKLMGYLSSGTLVNFLEQMVAGLHEQDTFRQLNQDEKICISNIKELKEKKKTKIQEFQDDLADKEKTIAQLKEEYLKARTMSEFEMKYLSKVLKANEGTKFRMFKQELSDLQFQKAALQEKIRVEELVNSKVCSFLANKNENAKRVNNDWVKLREDKNHELEERIVTIKDEQTKLQAELDELTKKIEFEEERNMDKRRKEEEEEAVKEKERQEKEKLSNAIQTIQKEYLQWQEANPKKPKKPKSAKKKKR